MNGSAVVSNTAMHLPGALVLKEALICAPATITIRWMIGRFIPSRPQVIARAVRQRLLGSYASVPLSHYLEITK